MIYNTVVVDCL